MVNRQLFLKASTTSQLVGRIVEAQLEQVGIPAFLLALLTHVRELEPMSPTGISLASGAPPTTLRDNIQRLVDRRLVRRVPNPHDGRSYLLVLTRRGEIAVRAADPALLDRLRTGASEPVARRPKPLDQATMRRSKRYQLRVARRNATA